MTLNDSFELLTTLEPLDLLKFSPPFWWPSYGTFEVVIGAILTQNTQWSRVQISLENLRQHTLLTPNTLAHCDRKMLMELIRPSGLFKAKASNLLDLSCAILDNFGDFETFVALVDRDWLLRQKGIGCETADAILCYGCQRPVMVVDSYTARLLRAFEYEFESYEELQAWCEAGIRVHYKDAQLPKIFAHFHGMIVEYVKANSRGRVVLSDPLNDLFLP